MPCSERLARAAAGSVEEEESIFTTMTLLPEPGTMALRATALDGSRTAAMTVLLVRWAYSATRPRPIPGEIGKCELCCEIRERTSVGTGDEVHCWRHFSINLYDRSKEWRGLSDVQAMKM